VKRPAVKIAAVVLLVLVAGLTWFLGTANGNQQLLQLIIPGNLQIGVFHGSVWKKMELNDIHYSQDQLDVKINKLALAWKPAALFSGRLHILQLHASDVDYSQPHPAGNDQPTSVPELPVAILLEQTRFENIHVQYGEISQEIQRIELRAESQGAEIQLPLVEISYAGFESHADGRLSLTELYPYTLDIRWQGNISDVGPASGSAKLSGDINSLLIDHVLQGPFRLTTMGKITLGPDKASLDLRGEWTDAHWPLTEKADVSSPTGLYQLSGPLDTPTLDTTATLIFPQKQAPDMHAHSRGQLSANGLDDLVLESQMLGGKTLAKGRLQWSPAITWDLSITGQELDPARQWPEWPGNLSLDSTLQGGIDSNGLKIEARLSKLSGTLHDYPLSASGQGHYDQAGLKLQSLQIRNGPNQFNMQGAAGKNLDLAYELNAADLNILSPALKGKINSNGRLTGKMDHPQLSALLAASNLSYGEYRVAQVDGRIN